MKKKTIVLTGGGTTGHVSVNLALIPLLKENGWVIHYIGSKKGIERSLISPIEGVTYHPISSGRFSRGKSLSIFCSNIKDIFKIIWGTLQSIYYIFKIKPNVAFSKGGFVSVPVLAGAWINRVPSLTHESDLTPGLANKLVKPFVNTIFTTFEETAQHINSDKVHYLGPVIRPDLKNGNGDHVKSRLNITNTKPNILVMGGSQGSKFINFTIWDNLEQLSKRFNIIHLTGKGNINSSLKKENYFQFEYVTDGLNDVLDLADIVISRSGSNAIFEFLYYQIPMILIPLEKGSRGDQVENAKAFQEKGYSLLIREDESQDSLLRAIDKVYESREKYKANMVTFEFKETIDIIYKSLVEASK